MQPTPHQHWLELLDIIELGALTGANPVERNDLLGTRSPGEADDGCDGLGSFAGSGPLNGAG